MSTFKEENAITYRIAQMQVKWADSVTQETQLIRWLVKKNELRMVKAFHMLEASQHGKLPELFLNFEQPFISIEQYGKDLVDSWIALWNDEKSRNEVIEAGVLPNWNDLEYQSIDTRNSAWTFVKCMSSFASAISRETVLVLNIMPYGYVGNPEFVAWVKKCITSLPSNLKMVVIDLEDRQVFKDIPSYINEVVIEPNIKMHEAIREIISSEDTNNPAVGVNLCLLNIGEATNAKNEKEIHRWGKEAIKVAQQTTLKSIEATVLIAYGSALYQLKKFDDALNLFEKAEETSIEGLTTDPTAPTLLLQSYNIQASTYLYKKKYAKAQEYYIKTAEEAKTQNNGIMQIEACRQAAYSATKNGEKDIAYTLLHEAYTQGRKIDVQIQKFSSMLLISIKLHQYAEDYRNDNLKKEIAQYATNIWGEHWQDISQRENYQQVLTT